MSILDRLHAVLQEVYAGGSMDALNEVLTEDVEWHIPGDNAIAGSYIGIDQVRAYFEQRRQLAQNSLRLEPGEVLAGDGCHVAVLTDGSATIADSEHRWSTVGLYRIRDGRISACWLLPLDPAAFDRAWSARAVASADPVLILTGAPGTGKTTVAHELARGAERAVHLESDHFFRFIEAGYIEPWNPEAGEQNTLVMRLVGDVAAGYAAAGYSVIVDGIVIPRWFLEPLHDRLERDGHRVAYAVLRAPLGTCIERCAERDAEQLSEPGVVEQLWNEFAALGPLESHVVDVSGLTSEAVASAIAQRLRGDLLTLGQPTAQ